MKNLIVLIVISISSLSLHASERTCVLDEVNTMLSTLAKDMDAVCGWTIHDVVKKSILKECSKASEKDGVLFRSSAHNELRFTQYSYTYDVSEPFYYCKNKSGYEAYYAQTVLTLNEEVRASNRAKYDAVRRSSPVRRASSRAKPTPKQETMWRCVIPNYIPIPKLYSEEEKKVLDLTYRGDHRYACGLVK